MELFVAAYMSYCYGKIQRTSLIITSSQHKGRATSKYVNRLERNRHAKHRDQYCQKDGEQAMPTVEVSGRKYLLFFQSGETARPFWKDAILLSSAQRKFAEIVVRTAVVGNIAGSRNGYFIITWRRGPMT